MKVLISTIACIVLFASCQKQKKEDELEFRYFNLENAGWKSRIKSQKIDDMSFQSVLVPLQYYILKQNGKNRLEQVDSIYKTNQKERIIEFILQDDKGQDILDSKFTNQDYASSVEYISFKIDKDFYLIANNKDTIKCSGVLHERNYKIAPYTKIMLFFSDVDPDAKIQLIYNDVLFRKGIMKFTFTDPIIKL